MLICSHRQVVSVRRAQENDTPAEVEDWFDLVRYLMGISFVTFGALVLMYEPLHMHHLLRRYHHSSRRIQGTVLSCEEIPDAVKKFRLRIIYSAPSMSSTTNSSHASSSLSGVGPARRQIGNHEGPKQDDVLLYVDYLKYQESNWLLSRGSSVDLLLLPNEPRSACTREWVDICYTDYASVRRAIIIFIPSSLILLLLSWLCIQKINIFPKSGQRKLGTLVALLTFIASFFIALSVAHHKMKETTRKLLFNARVARKSSPSENNKKNNDNKNNANENDGIEMLNTATDTTSKKTRIAFAASDEETQTNYDEECPYRTKGLHMTRQF